ncbi:hypothetical protein ACQZV8_11980 [Magnetococcales bacterium HHB-1]
MKTFELRVHNESLLDKLQEVLAQFSKQDIELISLTQKRQNNQEIKALLKKRKSAFKKIAAIGGEEDTEQWIKNIQEARQSEMPKHLPFD